MDIFSGVIYRLTSPDGKEYIGQTIDFKRRMRRYETEKYQSSPIYIAIRKYGFDAFSKEVVEVVEAEDKSALKLRLDHIEADNISLVPIEKRLNVYRWDSRTTNYHPSKEVKSKMSKAHKGKKQSKLSRSKRAGSFAYQGKTVMSKELGKTFSTLREAAHYAGISNGCKISEVISGKRKSAGKIPGTNKKISDWQYVQQDNTVPRQFKNEL